MEKVKILIDTKGGDNGAAVMIKGAALALEKFGALSFVLIGDEATVKTFYRENGVFRLQPENHTMAPIITKEVYILGKVIANIRYY